MTLDKMIIGITLTRLILVISLVRLFSWRNKHTQSVKKYIFIIVNQLYFSYPFQPLDNIVNNFVNHSCI